MYFLSDFEAAQCNGACRHNHGHRALARNRDSSIGQYGPSAMRFAMSIAITIVQINNSFNLVVNGGSIVSSQANGLNSVAFV
jgi:hypothetical protein